MSAMSTTNPNGAPLGPDQTAIEYPSQFIGETANIGIRGTGTLFYKGTEFIVKQLSLAGYLDQARGVFPEGKYEIYEEKGLQFLNVAGIIYQAYTNVFTFSLGFIFGVLSGLKVPLFKLNFLDRLPDNIWNKNSGYLAQKVQAILFALNFIDLFKNPILDNIIFSGFGGFTAGVTFHKWLKESAGGTYSTISEQISGLIKLGAEAANSTGYVNIDLSVEQQQPVQSNQQTVASRSQEGEGLGQPPAVDLEEEMTVVV